LARDGKLWFGIADVLTIMGEPQNDSLLSPTYISALDIMTLPQNFVSNKEIQSKLSATDTIWNKEKDTFYTKNNLPVNSGYLQQNNIQWDSTEGPYNLPGNLKLPYSQNHLTFHFTGTHLDNMNKTRYRYVLEGTDRAWSAITDKAYAEYRNLSFGKYTFKVSSVGFNGRWSQPVVFNFTVLPPWWLSAWAYIFYGLCVVGLIFMADRIQRRRLLARERERTKDRELAQAKEIEKAYTELKTTQAQLIQAEKMASLGELTAGIAHEIQNPLNFVNNFSEVNTELIDELKEDLQKGKTNEAISIADNVKQNNEKITYHGKRADSIVKGMLQHSRNSNGKKEPTDINTLADECLRLSYHGMRAKDNSFNIKMETQFDSSLPLININSQEVGRVLLNLFTNAFYSLQQKKRQAGDHFEPTVTVKTTKTLNGISIIVSDNGNGIPQKVIDKIFHPFFTTKPTGEGTGLGLSMSYDIITKGHGGELKVETKEGEFAEFTITLPV
jgi:signal transduction histidine kinase